MELELGAGIAACDPEKQETKMPPENSKREELITEGAESIKKRIQGDHIANMQIIEKLIRRAKEDPKFKKELLDAINGTPQKAGKSEESGRDI